MSAAKREDGKKTSEREAFTWTLSFRVVCQQLLRGALQLGETLRDRLALCSDSAALAVNFGSLRLRWRLRDR